MASIPVNRSADIANIADNRYSRVMTISTADVAPIRNVDAEIGRRVHQLMWDRGMRQTQMATAIGMDQSSVAKRLRGKLGWSATMLIRTAAVLDTTVGYLVGETDNSTNNPVGPAGLEPTTSTVDTRRVAPVIPLTEAPSRKARRQSTITAA